MIPLWVELLIVAACMAIAGALGAHVQGNADKAVAAHLVAVAVATERAERARTDAVSAHADDKAAAVAVENEQKNETLIREIPRYVQNTHSVAGLADAFRVFNNAAATGLPVSAPTGPVDDSPAAIEDVAAGVAGNLATCRAELERFGQLQDWIDGVTKK
jgi:hypothetical protein